MRNDHGSGARLLDRPFLRLSMLFVFVAISGGCGDSSGGGSGGSGDGSFLHVITPTEDLRASLAVNTANTFFLDDGSSFYTFVVGGWTDDGDFGTINARIWIFGETGEEVGPGTYALTPETDRVEGNANLSLDFAGKVGVVTSGTLTLVALDGSLDGSLDRISMTFEGIFSVDGEDPEPIEGEIRYR